LSQEDNNRNARLTAETMEKLYATSWGWVARLSSGQLWILGSEAEKWREWKLRLPTSSGGTAPASRKNSRPSAAAPNRPVVQPTGSELVFTEQDGYVPTKDGLLRCTLAGNCVRLQAFGRGTRYGPLQVSPEGSMLQAIVDGKLAMSSDGGQTAIWVDLPVNSSNVLWLKNFVLAGKHSIFLGTTEGLFSSAENGGNWKPCEQGLPAGQIEHVVQGHGFLAASLREGGMYVSVDQGKTWTRDFQDAERSRFTGMVETSPGTLTLGTQSEGVLRWQIHSN
jgi:hypothetical protein